MRTLLIITLLITHPLQAAELLLTNIPTPIQSSKNAATKAWAALPNKADPIFLDHFIATYPQSDQAQIAFTLRFNGVQTSRSILHYHAFIEKYRDTLAAEQALFELFELYQQQNTLSGYFDFIKRYPNTPQAVVAQLHVEALAFELASQLDTIADYEAFIDVFPTAAQVTAAEQLAQKQTLKLEKAYLDSELARLNHRLEQEQQALNQLERSLETNPDLLDDFSFWQQLAELEDSLTGLKKDIRQIRENRAGELATEMETLASLAEAVLDKDMPEAEQNLQVQNLWRRVMRHFYLLRSELYSKTAAAKRVRPEERHQRILKKLEAIRLAIENSNQALIVALQTEFAKTRQTLRQGFDRLHLDNLLINESLQQLVVGVEVLHHDLAEVNRNLVKIHQGLTDVQATIAQSNAHLLLLHEDLDRVRVGLIRLNQDMNQGMEKQKTLLRAVAGTVKQGFGQLHADMEARKVQSASLHQEKLALANRQLYANQRISRAIEKTHQQSLAQRAKQTEALRQNIQSQGEVIVNAQSLTLKAVEHQTEVTLYNTDKLLASERQTQGLISQQTEQFAHRTQQKSSSGGGCFKSLVSMATNVFAPGLGAFVGPLVDVVSDVVEGKDIGEALIGGAKGVVAEQCPPCAPAMDIAEGLVQGKDPQDVLLNVAKNQLGDYCPECTPFVDVAGDLLEGKDISKTLENVAKSQLGDVCPECVQVWDTGKALAQGVPPEQVVSTLLTEKITSYCPNCAPVLDTVKQIAQGKAPLNIVVETTERQLAKDCPKCGEILRTIIPLAQGEAVETKNKILAHLQNQTSEQISQTLNAVLGELGLQAMPNLSAQIIFDGLPRLNGLQLEFLAVDRVREKQLNQQGLQVGSGKSLPALPEAGQVIMPTSDELMGTLATIW